MKWLSAVEVEEISPDSAVLAEVDLGKGDGEMGLGGVERGCVGQLGDSTRRQNCG